MLERAYLGIDPGASGGIALILPAARQPSLALVRVQVWKMPVTEDDVWDQVRSAVEGPVAERRKTYAVIEKVGGHIGVPQPGWTMFKFGASYGGLRMALVANGLKEYTDWQAIRPQDWQKAVGVVRPDGRTANETKTSFKNRLKEKAEQLYPGVKLTLATSDALLLAHYCRLKVEGRL